MSPFNFRSKVSIALLHVRREVSIAPLHVQSKFYPDMEGSNADFAPHKEEFQELTIATNLLICKKI